MRLLSLLLVELKKLVLEKGFPDHLPDTGQVDYGLFSNFQVGVLSQGFKLQPDELFTQVLTEERSHLAEQLNGDDSIVLIGIVMGHFQYILKHALTSTATLDQVCHI